MGIRAQYYWAPSSEPLSGQTVTPPGSLFLTQYTTLILIIVSFVAAAFHQPIDVAPTMAEPPVPLVKPLLHLQDTRFDYTMANIFDPGTTSVRAGALDVLSEFLQAHDRDARITIEAEVAGDEGLILAISQGRRLAEQLIAEGVSRSAFEILVAPRSLLSGAGAQGVSVTFVASLADTREGI